MRKYDKNKLDEIVKISFSIADVCRKMNIRPVGGNYKTLKKYIKIYEIDISHFTGQAWNVGEKFKSFSKKLNLDEILIENSTYTNTYSLKRRLINEGVIKNECEECGLTEWNGKKISLHLDHKNGNNLDNRIENLRLLCPNCHSQTDTYCNSSIKSQSSTLRKKRFEIQNKLFTYVKVYKETKMNYYCSCGAEIDKRSKLCKKCMHLSQRKVKNRPTKEELIIMIKESSFVAVGKKYGVSDNTVRKWIK